MKVIDASTFSSIAQIEAVQEELAVLSGLRHALSLCAWLGVWYLPSGPSGTPVPAHQPCSSESHPAL